MSAGQQVGRELDAVELAGQAAGDGLADQRLAHAGHVLQAGRARRPAGPPPPAARRRPCRARRWEMFCCKPRDEIPGFVRHLDRAASTQPGLLCSMSHPHRSPSKYFFAWFRRSMTVRAIIPQSPVQMTTASKCGYALQLAPGPISFRCRRRLRLAAGVVFRLRAVYGDPAAFPIHVAPL